MKKIILTLIAFVVCMAQCLAVTFIPKYTDDIKSYGIGLFFGKGTAVVYERPTESSQVVANLSWNQNKVSIDGVPTEPKNVFAVFIPEKSLSGFIATDEQDDYTEIIYSRDKNLSGWVKNDGNRAFYWRQLFYKYGKTNGVYVFANYPKDKRILMLAPDVSSEVSQTFVYPKHITLQLIKGNWALVKVVDYDDEQKVGWFKWRNQTGTLNMFPQFID